MENDKNLKELIDERNELARERNLLASERTRFSAERTVSAWMRTGLATVGAGFAIVRLLEFEEATHRVLADVIGEFLIIWGIVVFIFALKDYTANCQRLEQKLQRRNQWWVSITIFIFIIVSLFLLYVTLSQKIE